MPLPIMAFIISSWFKSADMSLRWRWPSLHTFYIRRHYDLSCQSIASYTAQNERLRIVTYWDIQKRVSNDFHKEIAILHWMVTVTSRFHFFSQSRSGILKCTASKGSLNLESLPWIAGRSPPRGLPAIFFWAPDLPLDLFLLLGGR